MQVYTKSVRLAMALLLAVFAMGLIGAPAMAQYRDRMRMGVNPAELAHRALRYRIRHDAHDRFGIRFHATDVQRIDGGRRMVSGDGMFQRRGKDPQHFTYRAMVNAHNGNVFNLNYQIQ